MCLVVAASVMASLVVGLVIYGIAFSICVFIQAALAIKGPKWSTWILPGLAIAYECVRWTQNIRLQSFNFGLGTFLLVLFMSALLPVVLLLEAKLIIATRERIKKNQVK